MTEMFSTFSRAHNYNTRLSMTLDEPISLTPCGQLCIRYYLPKIVNKTNAALLSKVDTMSFESFTRCVKRSISTKSIVIIVAAFHVDEKLKQQGTRLTPQPGDSLSPSARGPLGCYTGMPQVPLEQIMFLLHSYLSLLLSSLVFFFYILFS